jgi:hypothetical protein
MTSVELRSMGMTRPLATWLRSEEEIVSAHLCGLRIGGVVGGFRGHHTQFLDVPFGPSFWRAGILRKCRSSLARTHPLLAGIPGRRQ